MSANRAKLGEVLELTGAKVAAKADWVFWLGNNEWEAWRRCFKSEGTTARSLSCPQGVGRECVQHLRSTEDVWVAFCGKTPRGCERREYCHEDVEVHRLDFLRWARKISSLLQIEGQPHLIDQVPWAVYLGSRKEPGGPRSAWYLTLSVEREDMAQLLLAIGDRRPESARLLVPSLQAYDRVQSRWGDRFDDVFVLGDKVTIEHRDGSFVPVGVASSRGLLHGAEPRQPKKYVRNSAGDNTATEELTENEKQQRCSSPANRLTFDLTGAKIRWTDQNAVNWRTIERAGLIGFFVALVRADEWLAADSFDDMVMPRKLKPTTAIGYGRRLLHELGKLQEAEGIIERRGEGGAWAIRWNPRCGIAHDIITLRAPDE